MKGSTISLAGVEFANAKIYWRLVIHSQLFSALTTVTCLLLKIRRLQNEFEVAAEFQDRIA